ncbi:MAG: hypothetical protein QM811_19730 [Pirellulales bacterium]
MRVDPSHTERRRFGGDRHVAERNLADEGVDVRFLQQTRERMPPRLRTRHVLPSDRRRGAEHGDTDTFMPDDTRFTPDLGEFGGLFTPRQLTIGFDFARTQSVRSDDVQLPSVAFGMFRSSIPIGMPEHQPATAFTDDVSQYGDEFRRERNRTFASSLNPPAQSRFVPDMPPARVQIEILDHRMPQLPRSCSGPCEYREERQLYELKGLEEVSLRLGVEGLNRLTVEDFALGDANDIEGIAFIRRQMAFFGPRTCTSIWRFPG